MKILIKEETLKGQTNKINKKQLTQGMDNKHLEKCLWKKILLPGINYIL
jgi:hypothetical protein